MRELAFGQKTPQYNFFALQKNIYLVVFELQNCEN